MKQIKISGILLIIGALGVFIPYLILTIKFDYPGILREEPGIILRQFHAGGTPLILTWLAFALCGLPLLPAYSIIGQKLETKIPFTRWVTTIGIISGIVQVVGLLRWVFVVPVLANNFIAAKNESVQESIEIIFQVVHQFGGVLLGEHMGQLFTVIWTAIISFALVNQLIISRWLGWFGYISSAIYFLAQAELLATVIEGFPVWNAAGFLGSTLWLLWLILVGVSLIKFSKKSTTY
jgi:hypothetical protein